jgi:uncharacterized protein
MEQERRYIGVELRALEEGGRIIEGYALKFNTESHDLGGFRETIAPGALNGADLSDVVAAFNHNYDKVLARSSAGTLQLTIDDIGLKYRFEAPNTTAGNDLLEDIRLGNVSKSSFAFSINRDDQQWEDRGGYLLRTITKFKRIHDVSPVVFPAYEDTTSARRSMEDFLKAKEGEETPKEEENPQPVKRGLDLYKLKLNLKLKQNV